MPGLINLKNIFIYTFNLLQNSFKKDRTPFVISPYIVDSKKLYIHYEKISTTYFSCAFACKRKRKQTRAIKKYSINQFMDNEAVGGGSFSVDNSKIISVI